MTDWDIERIRETVREILSRKGQERGLDFALGDYELDEDWLYLCVTPTQKGIRVYDYAEILGEVEKELRKAGIHKVLLVPTLEDWA